MLRVKVKKNKSWLNTRHVNMWRSCVSLPVCLTQPHTYMSLFWSLWSSCNLSDTDTKGANQTKSQSNITHAFSCLQRPPRGCTDWNTVQFSFLINMSLTWTYSIGLRHAQFILWPLWPYNLFKLCCVISEITTELSFFCFREKFNFLQTAPRHITFQCVCVMRAAEHDTRLCKVILGPFDVSTRESYSYLISQITYNTAAAPQQAWDQFLPIQLKCKLRRLWLIRNH